MLTSTLLHSGSVCVLDFDCSAGPDDRPFVEMHGGHSLSYVRRGSFCYHSRGKSFEMVAGSILIGCPGDEYMCTHEHVRGDACLSLHLEPQLIQAIGGDNRIWKMGAMPPSPELMMLGELAHAAAHNCADIGADEAGLLFAARFAEIACGCRQRALDAPACQRRRAVTAALWLEANAHESIDLDRAARQAGLSPFHFLRLFSRVLGVTPHQYLVSSRLRSAARMLIDSDQPIAEVALDVGFSDLSNFVRAFRRACGMSPRRFRQAARGNRKTGPLPALNVVTRI